MVFETTAIQNKGRHMTQLSGKVAFVTGAGGGIGRAIAIALAREGAAVGINVMSNRAGGEDTLAAIVAAGGKGMVLRGDISEPGIADGLVAALSAELGPVTVLVNNSGIGSPNSIDTVLDIDLDDWDRVMAVNVRGTVLCARAVLRGMIAASGGAIINIASIRGVTAARNLAAYCSSKGAIVSLTQEMALDYARQGVRVNAISPGFVESEMFKGYLDRQPDPTSARARFASTAALNRIGRPEEVAEAVVFLASDEASFVVGANLLVDGGNMANGLRAFL